MPATRLSALTRRILSRLEQAEANEPNPWVRTDYRIARLTVVHAARGDCHHCSPHVSASYEVLGLHPEKVWPCIMARRRALLGPLFEISGAQLPPKKTPQPARVMEDLYRARAVGEFSSRKTNGSESSLPSRVRTLTEPPMASATATEYSNSGASKSRFFSREAILTLIEQADYSYRDRRGRLRCGRHLRDTLRAFWRIENLDGTQVHLFSAVAKVAKAAGISERAARYNLRALEEPTEKYPRALGLLSLRFKQHDPIRPGYSRNVNTHELRFDRLQRRRHSAQLQPVPPAAPSKRELAVAKGMTRGDDRVRQARLELMQRFALLRKGCKGNVQTAEGMRWVAEGDRDYREPMSPESAWPAAIMDCGLTEREVREKLQLSLADLNAEGP